MTVKLAPNSPRCKGRSRQHGGPCGLPPIPFGDFCRFHGGNRKEHREKARKRMLEYAQWSTDPWYIKNIRIRQWQEAQDRWEMRRAKKAGPQAVMQLKAHRAAEKAERDAWIAENKRAKAEKHRQAAEAARRAKGLPAPTPYDDEPSRVIPWDLGVDMDWEL